MKLYLEDRLSDKIWDPTSSGHTYCSKSQKKEKGFDSAFCELYHPIRFETPADLSYNPWVREFAEPDEVLLIEALHFGVFVRLDRLKGLIDAINATCLDGVEREVITLDPKRTTIVSYESVSSEEPSEGLLTVLDSEESEVCVFTSRVSTLVETLEATMVGRKPSAQGTCRLTNSLV